MRVWVISSLEKKRTLRPKGVGCSFHAKWPLILQSKISFYKLQEGGPWSAVFCLTLCSGSRSGKKDLRGKLWGRLQGCISARFLIGRPDLGLHAFRSRHLGAAKLILNFDWLISARLPAALIS